MMSTASTGSNVYFTSMACTSALTALVCTWMPTLGSCASIIQIARCCTTPGSPRSPCKMGGCNGVQSPSSIWWLTCQTKPSIWTPDLFQPMQEKQWLAICPGVPTLAWMAHLPTWCQRRFFGASDLGSTSSSCMAQVKFLHPVMKSKSCNKRASFWIGSWERASYTASGSWQRALMLHCASWGEKSWVNFTTCYWDIIETALSPYWNSLYWNRFLNQ